MAEEYTYIEQTDAVQADADLYNQAEAKGGDVEGDLTVSGKIEGSIDVSNVHGLAPVATSGDYADLTGTPTEFEGATASADGASGLVPKPEAGDQDKVLKGDGTWGTVTASSVAWSDVTGKPSSFTPSSHTHGNLTNDGKVGTASGKPLVTGTGGAVQAGSFGTTAGTFCEGNDSRLSNARTPTSHTHVGTEVALTGYSKPSTTSAIAATDTVNAAVGKLEKDNDYLHDEFLLVKGVADNAYAVGTANTLLIQDLQDALDTMLKTKIYPVGSTFFSLTDSRNPSVILGFGTWTAIEGRFLLGASSSYAASSTGGEATHTLTVDEMPSHKHGIVINPGSGFSAGIAYTSSGGVNNNFVQAAGGGQAHNNLPPYLAGYLWRRTA